MKTTSKLMMSFTLSIMATAAAAERLRYAELGPNQGWRQGVTQYMVKELEARTNGEITAEVSYAGSLLPAQNVLGGVGDGLADIGSFVGVYTPQIMTNYRVADIPTRNADAYIGMSAIYEVATSDPIVQAEFDRLNLVYLGNYTSSSILLSCREPVTKLSDLDGLKVRSNPPHSDVFKEQGAVIVALPFPEVYQALDKGLVDCAQTYWEAIVGYKIYEAAPYITDLKWSQNYGIGIVMNKDVFEGLSPENQQIVRNIGYDMTMWVAKFDVESTQGMKDIVTSAPGVEVVELEDAEHDALVEAGLKQADAFTGDPSVREAYLAAVDKYVAKFEADGYPWSGK